MTNLMLFLAVLALLGYAIERNHRRQRPGRFNGSVNYEDRDEARIAAELRGLPPSVEVKEEPAPHDHTAACHPCAI